MQTPARACISAYEKRVFSSFNYESNPTALAVPVREKKTDSQPASLGPCPLNVRGGFYDGDGAFAYCSGYVRGHSNKTANN